MHASEAKLSSFHGCVGFEVDVENAFKQIINEAVRSSCVALLCLSHVVTQSCGALQIFQIATSISQDGTCSPLLPMHYG